MIDFNKHFSHQTDINFYEKLPVKYKIYDLLKGFLDENGEPLVKSWSMETRKVTLESLENPNQIGSYDDFVTKGIEGEKWLRRRFNIAEDFVVDSPLDYFASTIISPENIEEIHSLCRKLATTKNNGVELEKKTFMVEAFDMAECHLDRNGKFLFDGYTRDGMPFLGDSILFPRYIGSYDHFLVCRICENTKWTKWFVKKSIFEKSYKRVDPKDYIPY